jgi:hypothetical protein
MKHIWFLIFSQTSGATTCFGLSPTGQGFSFLHYLALLVHEDIYLVSGSPALSFWLSLFIFYLSLLCVWSKGSESKHKLNVPF